VDPPVAPTDRVKQGGERSIHPVQAQIPDRQPAAGGDSHPSRKHRPSDARVDHRPSSPLGERRIPEVARPTLTPAFAMRDDRRPQVPDEPTVQVTIGRVEIRATVAPTPARKPAVLTPAMSLDEYLKRRNEASR
jgi:hypothetical protein